jgi:predicted pyridoxine 5'-phosphate oxidase superfamily flavin-nucleotide-binding protein
MSWEKPFHEGELKAQKLAGETAEAESNSAMISDSIMTGALTFVRAQQMAIVSSRDDSGRRWASFLFGEKGFLQPVDRQTLRILAAPAEMDREDPFWQNIEHEQQIGLLVIDLATRRRLRINGPILRDGKYLEMRVEESYPNCPKYITRRKMNIHALEASNPSAAQELKGSRLQQPQQDLLKHTDVLFVATGHPKRGGDASHRGGRPGFVQVQDEHTLRIPDYSGNGLFNTLGNLLIDPHIGLLIPDFEGNRELQITGSAKVEWSAPDPEDLTGGTHRIIEVQVEEWRQRPMSVAVESVVIDYSPYDP